MTGKITVKKPKMKRADAVFYAVCAAIPVLHFLVFYLGVNFNSFVLAFQNFDGEGSSSFAGLYNLISVAKDLFTNPVLTIAIKNSLIYAACNFLIGTTLALFFSYYIFKGHFMANAFRVILFVPSIISAIVTVLVFRYAVTNLLPALVTKIFGVPMQGLLDNPATKFPTIIFYNIWVGFGSSTLLYVGAMKNISESVMESAKLEGAGAITEFFRIVFPLIWQTFITFVITNLTLTFTTQLELYSFYGSGAEATIQTIGYYMYLETLKNSKIQLPYLASMGLIITFFLAPVTLGIRYLMNRFGPSAD